MTAEEIRTMIRRFVDEPWNKGNVAAIDEICASDYTLHYLPEVEKDGREDLKQAVLKTRAASRDFHAEVDDIIVEGERVAYLWRMSWTNEQDKFEKVVGITLLRIVDGRIVEDRFVSADVKTE